MAQTTETPCRGFAARLALLAGDDLSADELRCVWGHLARCVPCRRELAALRRGRALLEALPGGPRGACEAPMEGSLPDEFFAALHRDVMNAVGRAASDEHCGRAPRLRRFARLAAALLLFASGVLFSHLLDRRTPRNELLDGDAIGAPSTPVAARRHAPRSVLTPVGLQGQIAAERWLERFERQSRGLTPGGGLETLLLAPEELEAKRPAAVEKARPGKHLAGRRR